MLDKCCGVIFTHPSTGWLQKARTHALTLKMFDSIFPPSFSFEDNLKLTEELQE